MTPLVTDPPQFSGRDCRWARPYDANPGQMEFSEKDTPHERAQPRLRMRGAEISERSTDASLKGRTATSRRPGLRVGTLMFFAADVGLSSPTSAKVHDRLSRSASLSNAESVAVSEGASK
jgi:hypothetical protein